MSQTSVLYDVPGPRALARNKLLGIATVVVIVALVAFLVYRLSATGNLSADKWQIFGYAAIWTQIAEALWATLSAFLVAAVGALALGFVLAIGRLSDHAWVRIPFTVVVEGLRAIPVLILMMLMYYGLPAIGIKMEPFWAVVIALIAYNGSVLSEVIRSGVQSLPIFSGEQCFTPSCYLTGSQPTTSASNSGSSSSSTGSGSGSNSNSNSNTNNGGSTSSGSNDGNTPATTTSKTQKSAAIKVGASILALAAPVLLALF